ncbi:uncharacterized protein LOC116847203 [Odontomachus brunneus]|uniref:uncharacterized protein LOC116847203 n=1 Tax=Odontomachus brunneus TaxID=486640 RepID=UPI0013F2A013|nr:uncharacterized protein LOC116847203 [Odontomachus brunneus]
MRSNPAGLTSSSLHTLTLAQTHVSFQGNVSARALRRGCACYGCRCAVSATYIDRSSGSRGDIVDISLQSSRIISRNRARCANQLRIIVATARIIWSLVHNASCIFRILHDIIASVRRTTVSHFSGNTIASITRSWRLAALTRLLVNQEGFLDKLGDYHDCRYERIGRGSCCPKADVRAFNVHHGGKKGKKQKIRRHQDRYIGCDTSRQAAGIALFQIDFYLNRRFELKMRISIVPERPAHVGHTFRLCIYCTKNYEEIAKCFFWNNIDIFNCVLLKLVEILPLIN